jgi:hypothetical protein
MRGRTGARQLTRAATFLTRGAAEDDTRTQLAAASLTTAFRLLAERGATKTNLWTPEEIAARASTQLSHSCGTPKRCSSHAERR